MNKAITFVLRAGVIISIALMLVGVVVAFSDHPQSFSSHPGNVHFPNTVSDVIDGLRHVSGEAIIMVGLLTLIATPIARVALSVIIFIIARDRLYTAITAAVLAILLISYAVGAVAR